MASETIALADLSVNRMGYGAMRVCGPDVWGPPQDRAAAHRLLRRAIELGVNFVDTADSYGPHVDEELIAEALHPYPKDLVIGTKGGLLRPDRQAWDRNGRPGHLRSAVEGSLKRLRLERIDLYQSQQVAYLLVTASLGDQLQYFDLPVGQPLVPVPAGARWLQVVFQQPCGHRGIQKDLALRHRPQR